MLLKWLIYNCRMNSIPYMTFSIRPGMLMKFEGKKKPLYTRKGIGVYKWQKLSNQN